MHNLSFRAALPLLFATFAISASAQDDVKSTPIAEDSSIAEAYESNQKQHDSGSEIPTLEPRTYMGETVMVPTDTQDYTPKNPSWWSRVRANGAIQTEFMVPLQDKALMTQDYDSPVLNNTYFDFTLNAPYVSAGARFQFTKWPLPGFDQATMPGFAGWGVPYFWITGKYISQALTSCRQPEHPA